jgi:hypothetical protein
MSTIIPWRTGQKDYLTFYFKEYDVNRRESSFDLTEVSTISLYLQRYGESTIRLSATMSVYTATEGIARYLFDASGYPEGDYIGEVIATMSTGEKKPSEFFLLRMEKSLPRT